MTPEQLASLILVILGVALQLAFKYAPSFSDWYQNHANKGTLALAFAVLVGVVYFVISCTPYAADLGISISCDRASVFTLLRAIFIIASSQQLAFLLGKNNPASE